MNAQTVPFAPSRRSFLQVVGASTLLAATGCSTELPVEAVAAWRNPGAGEQDPRLWALAHAILAPHSHNLQSWKVDLRGPGEIMLYCDLSRLLPETDPQSRQIMMSHGTFLELLDIAARERGHRTEVELFPQGAYGPKGPDQRPVARVRLVADATVARDPLFAAITRRHTNRSPYEARVPTAPALQAIAAAVRPEPFRVGFATEAEPAQMLRHREIAREAWRIELVTPRTLMESMRVLRVGPQEIAQHRDGLSLNDYLPRLLTKVGMMDRTQAPAADSMAIRKQVGDFGARIDATPAFFWLVTEGNDRVTQVQAGRAYVRAQLAATLQGLSMHPLSQALQEYPEQAGPYAAIHELLGAPRPRATVQMWARLGHAPAVGPAPRRGLQAHLMQA